MRGGIAKVAVLSGWGGGVFAVRDQALHGGQAEGAPLVKEEEAAAAPLPAAKKRSW
jgi:hypothetical protein